MNPILPSPTNIKQPSGDVKEGYGLGAAGPFDTNDTPLDRTLNRIVEFVKR